MSGPDKCEWCGCYEIIRDGFQAINGGREVLFGCGSVWQEDAAGGNLYFRCLTRYYSDDRQWHISDTCAANCVMQMPDLRQRIADAIDAAQRSIRFGLEANSSIECVFAADMDRVVDILQGNSPEIPDGSNKRESEQ